MYRSRAWPPPGPPKLGGGWQSLAGFPPIFGGRGAASAQTPRMEGKQWAVFAGSHEVAQPRSLFFKKSTPESHPGGGWEGVAWQLPISSIKSR